MSAGAYISGAAHLLVILWVVLGGVLFRAEDPEVLETTSVRLLSENEFLSLTATRPEPRTVQQMAALRAPGIEELAASASPGDVPPELAPRPEIAEPANPDARPEAPDISAPAAEVDEAVPEAPVAPAADAMIALLPPALTPGRPKDAPRVSSAPLPEAPPTLEEAPEFVAPKAPTAETAPDSRPERDEPPRAPPESTTQIVTEADREEPLGAKVSGFPPRLRPPQRDPVPPRETAAAQPPATQGGSQTAATDRPAEPDLPVGPPLSFGEVNRLVAALEQCWSIGTLSTAAASSTVIVGVTMNPNGTPDARSIRMLKGDGPDDGSVRTAYEYAKRAVQRCGLKGFPLPKEKYAHWQEIEITFSPEDGLLFE